MSIGLAVMGAGCWRNNVVRTSPSLVPLKHIEPVFSLEDTCDVKLDGEELSQLDSLDAIVTAVERNRG